MNAISTPSRYGALSQALHWVMAALIIAGLAVIEIKGWFPKGTPGRDAVKTIHAQLGLVAFALVWLRLAWRSGHPAPRTAASQPWMERAAKLGHWTLYALMVILPLTGIAMAQLNGKPLAFLGLPLPVLLAPDKELGHTLHELHEVLGNVMIAVLALHILATAWHHLVRHDDTLRRMLPRRLA